MFVLRVNIYSAGSSCVRSGTPTIVDNGIGGSVPWTNWYGEIPVVRDTVMLRLNTVGGNQSPQAPWFSPRVTARSNRLSVPKVRSICALLLGL